MQRKNKSKRAKNPRPSGRTRPQKSRVSPKSEAKWQKTLTAPVAQQLAIKPAPVFRFDKAAPNDEFPEGGLRIVGCIPNLTNDTLVGDTGAAAGAFPSHTILQLISPTAYSSAATSATTPMFGSTSPIAQIAQWFRRFRFRYLAFRYEGDSQTGVNGAVQISIDHEAASALASAAASVQQSTLSSPGAVRMPIWTMQCDIPLIDGMKTDAADELFHTTSAGSEVTATLASADQNQYFQGGVFAAIDAAVTGGGTFAHYRWEFVLDLYGFMSTPADSAITLETRALREEKSKQQRIFDQAEREKRIRHVRDCSDDSFVVLRAQEPSISELRPLPVSTTRGTMNLFHDERKSPISSKRAQSFKG